jgi:hypothetical protein
MKTTLLTFYVLVWPVLSALVMAGLVWGVWRDVRAAKRSGEELV